MKSRTSEALNAWRTLLGSAHVCLDDSTRRRAETATFATEQRVLAVLEPANRFEVQACVRIAVQHGIPLYPVSTGRNWGYGSSVPVKTDCAILKLSRMTGIHDYDPALGCVTVEPGVTQGMLHDFLRANGNEFWLDVTGSSEACSIIGNTVERGFGHTAYADHFANCCGFEVVLPDGDCIHTGFGRFANAKSTRVYRWGVGPFIDGLFSQSNLGIVTAMTVWLMPIPAYSQSFFFSVADDAALEPLIDALAPLRLRGTLQSAIHIGNAYRVMSTAQQYPFESAGGITPLPDTALQAAQKARNFGAWSGSGTLYGTRAEVALARKALKRALRNRVDKLRFLDDRALAMVERFQRPLKLVGAMDLSELLRVLKPVYGMMRGVPSDSILACTYWRKKGAIPTTMDPDRDGCGLLWCTPISPLGGRYARAVADIASEVLLAHRFEPAITVTMLTERCLENVISISYDRDIPGEDARAAACYEALLERLTAQGYYPYRLGIQSMDWLNRAEPEYLRFQQRLKAALDPSHILAPGRYGE